MTDNVNTRLIDRWFPVAAVDEACGTPAGSGLTEKALFTWFASRPLAQARGAALTALLPNDDELKPLVEIAVKTGDPATVDKLSQAMLNAYGGRPPVVLDMFSGRGIIPMEAARAGSIAIGIDLSPVATLAGRLLADYPARDWTLEPPVPFGSPDGSSGSLQLEDAARSERLADDVARVLDEVDRVVASRVEPYFPKNAEGTFPWGYVWTTTLPCDACRRRFPLLGSLSLLPANDKGAHRDRSMRLTTSGDEWDVEVVEGPPVQAPTYASAVKADGKKKKGKSARCLFCGHIHTLDSVKAKCEADQMRDRLLLVADVNADKKRFFRVPTDQERAAAENCDIDVDYGWPMSAVPDEAIPPGNVHTVMGSGYGLRTFGSLMVRRQARLFVETVQAIREVHHGLRAGGLSEDYTRALASYAASNLCRRLRRSTRGVTLALTRGGVTDLFQTECVINFSFDFFETGPGTGAGTWSSVSDSSIRAIRKLVRERRGLPARMMMASATALPRRDSSVDVVITDPPYYDMIEYADASDLFHVWLKRILYDIEPDLFGPDVQQGDGLQDKNQEIIVRRVHEPNRVRHDTEFYESMLAQSFGEARRVLKPQGHLVVVFGHSDPDAWRRLLGALQTAGFVVTSAWPSRTESGNTGVASIKVTVTIGCCVAPIQRPVGLASEVDLEVGEAVMERVRQWDADGLALEDQLMASYGPAMEVYGRYGNVINPDGTDADLDRYLTIARRAVRDAMRLRVDELPLETFDAITRFAIFWLRAKGRSEVSKGEARFFSQADELRLDDLRDSILSESKGGFQLRLDNPAPISQRSSTFEVVRAMAHAWSEGGTEAVANVIGRAGREPNDQHLWAVVADLANHLPASDATARALAGIRRTASTISMLIGKTLELSVHEAHAQGRLFDKDEEEA
jgi:putative DNA methylase